MPSARVWVVHLPCKTEVGGELQAQAGETLWSPADPSSA